MKGNRRPIRTNLLLLFLLFGATGSFAQKNLDNSIVNLGLRVGLNSLSSTHYDVYYNDLETGTENYRNKIGYLVNGFFRINLDHFFMQPEIEWNLYRQNCSFALPSQTEENTFEPDQTLTINRNSIDLNVLTGYNIVRTGPYLINCYIGGSFKTDVRTSFKLKGTGTDYLVDKWQYHYSGIMGCSMNIGIIHFDIRYQFNRPDNDLKIAEIDGIPEKYHPLKLRKNENILSFSCGVMF